MASRADRAEPFAAKLHFITHPVGRLNAARIRLARGYYLRSPGWVVLTTIGRRTGLPQQILLPCRCRRDAEIVVVFDLRMALGLDPQPAQESPGQGDARRS